MERSPLISINHAARYKFYCFLLVLPPPYVQTSSSALSSRTTGNAYTLNMEALKPLETSGTTRPVSRRTRCAALRHGQLSFTACGGRTYVWTVG